jgi:hypothetical protein
LEGGVLLLAVDIGFDVRMGHPVLNRVHHFNALLLRQVFGSDFPFHYPLDLLPGGLVFGCFLDHRDLLFCGGVLVDYDFLGRGWGLGVGWVGFV